jgi:hypothetical protein
MPMSHYINEEKDDKSFMGVERVSSTLYSHETLTLYSHETLHPLSTPMKLLLSTPMKLLSSFSSLI